MDFHDLMRHRVMDVLLVASPYDRFVLEEAGELSERMRGEFRNLDLHYGPGLTGVATGGEALALAREQSRFNLIVTTLELADMDAAELAARAREAGLELPVVGLAFDSRELADAVCRDRTRGLFRVYLWQGDARILVAMVKDVEDHANAPHDVGAGVQVLLVVEDSVAWYSSFLPALYSELLHQSQRLIEESPNLTDRITRMRARPKVLLCSSYEEAWDTFRRYGEAVLGVISDVEFPREGAPRADAGVALAHAVRAAVADVPVLLHSAHPENEGPARAAGADFLLKGSPRVRHELQRFMTTQLGFGDFVFRAPGGGAEVARASDLRSLEEAIRAVPGASLAYHAEKNHVSKWLQARTEFGLAHELRPRRVSDFADVEALRQSLLASIAEYRQARSQVMVADFERARFDGAFDFYRVGGGSLGGKGRGLAFMRRLLAEGDVVRGLGVPVSVPTALVLATDVFDRFLDENGLRDFALECGEDGAIVGRFLEAPLPEDVQLDLRAFLQWATWPLAVRSSSLLEDSQYQPFTGVYETYMLPNQGALETRLAQLAGAVRRVYASTFLRAAKTYVAATSFRLEEEKMAVVVQRVAGRAHATRFYPDFAGVARSHDAYRHPPLKAEDGMAAVALGLGRTVVEGGNCVRFCPRWPRQPAPGLSTLAEIRRNAQREFRALSLDGGGEGLREASFPLSAAEEDGVLGPLASTYSLEDDRLRAGVARAGLRVVTFAPLLQEEGFPLPELLRRLLARAAWGIGGPVEIEFAGCLPARGEPGSLAFLQLRPLALAREGAGLDLAAVPAERLLCRSESVLGNGRVELWDAVVVDQTRFERARSRETAQDLAALNAELVAAGVPYLLVGVGRWGSADPWLGIPVTWDQISGARVIVEAGFKDFRVTPSQGTHFFQNLASFDVGYFTVNPDVGEGFVDWGWLLAQPARRETRTVRHLRLARPLAVTMDGRRQQGVISKPDD